MSDEPNVAIAFALVIGAGAATGLGASVVFFPSLVKLASKRVLAGSLGISAGVMLYVSFIEIFLKSQIAFEDGGNSGGMALSYATLCFFGGVVLMLILDFFVHWLGGDHHGHSHGDDDCCSAVHDGGEDNLAAHCVGCICQSPDPVGDLEKWQHNARVEMENNETATKGTFASNDQPLSETVVSAEGKSDTFNVSKDDAGCTSGCCQVESGDEEQGTDAKNQIVESGFEAKLTEAQMREAVKLQKMGLTTALAIGIHNFPEGLATFVAALDDPSVGAVLAIAIGIHNIPEGLCVALPIYYATGDRKKAFLWACLSGVSEPIAALFGWLILANSFNDTMYAVLFGLVSGMMVTICIKELIPTAHRYDSKDTVVTYSIIAGMAVMAVSLVLFSL